MKSMTATVLQLDRHAHTSRVLGAWLQGRPGAVDRAFEKALDKVIPSPQAAGENTVTTNLSAEQLSALLGLSSLTASGVAVTADTALRVATVYGCVSLIAGTLAALPLGVYERTADARRKADHDYWWLFNERASDTFTSFAAWEYLISCKLLYGVGYAELLRPSAVSNKVIGWQPLYSPNVQPFRADGRVLYRVARAGGGIDVLDSADVIVAPSLGFDGLTAPSPITYAAREAIGVALAAENYSARFFSDGATFDYALKTASTLKAEQLDALRVSLAARLSGGKNSRAPLILAGGLEPAQLSVNPKDAEILSTRLFSVEEICRVFGVPPHMVAHTTKTTSWGSGIEEQGMGFLRYTLQRHLTPLAQELNGKLWPTRARFFVEHITQALERADLKKRNEAHRVALGRAGEPAWMTVNEVRRIENMPPVPGGDTLSTAAATPSSSADPAATSDPADPKDPAEPQE